MTPEQLIAAALAQRAQWVPLGEGKRVRMRRPSEFDMRGLVLRDADGTASGLKADLPEVKKFAIDWDGFKESDLIQGGADDGVPFHPEVFAVWVEDARQAVTTLAQAIIDAVIAHEAKRQEIEKN